MTPLQREALQMCLEYIETDAHERRHVRWKINEALAEPQPEPVAWMSAKRDMTYLYGPYNADDIPLYTSPPAQEIVCSTGLCHYRKPLTDEEIETVWRSVQANDFHDCVKPFARAIEAAHGIKGEA